MNTKREAISRVRNSIKAVNQDAFVTDRYIYSLILKYAKIYISRMEDANRLSRYQSLYETIPCMPLKEVSLIEACCANVKTCCTIRRTVDPLPSGFEGDLGPILRTVASIDGSQILQRTYPAIYTRMTNTTNFKYNKTKYYWILNNYIYIPELTWEAISVEGLWQDGIEMYKPCPDPCLAKQDELTAIPEKLFGEVESNVKNEILTTLQIPKEPAMSDNQSKFNN